MAVTRDERLPVNVKLDSPYGYLTTLAGARIENGRKGFRQEDDRIKFANYDEPVKVPDHWLAPDNPTAQP